MFGWPRQGCETPLGNKYSPSRIKTLGPIGKTCQKCSDTKCYTCFFDEEREDREMCINYGTDEPPENCEDGSPKSCDQCEDGFSLYRTKDNEDICAKDIKTGKMCPKNCTKCNSKGTKCKKCDSGYKLKKNGRCKKKT